MNLSCTNAKPEHLDELMYIENNGFSESEAATRTAMSERIQIINDTFIVAQNENSKIVGFIVGPAINKRYITDDLFEKTSPNDKTALYQTVLSLAVHPEYRKCGIAECLLEQLRKTAVTQNRKAITLTCLDKLVGFYEKYGYVNEGRSESIHANEIWYNMVLEL